MKKQRVITSDQRLSPIKKFSLLVFILLTLLGCQEQAKNYSGSDDLIELNAVRQKSRMANFRSYGMAKKKGDDWRKGYPTITGIPDSLQDVQVFYCYVDITPENDQLSEKENTTPEKHSSGTSEKDTTTPAQEKEAELILVVTGVTDSGSKYYLYDSNCNRDFADEIPYETLSVAPRFNNYNIDFQPHKVVFERTINNETVKDFRWIAFFEYMGKMYIQFNENTKASFSFNSVQYEIEAYSSTGADYGVRSFLKISKKDEPNKRRKTYNSGEYAFFDSVAYKVDCSKDGLKIRLTKETTPVESTAVGFAPPAFKAKTYTNESIQFPSDFRGKYVLLDFWALSCAPCIREIKGNYIEAYAEYKEKGFEIIGVANNSSPQLKEFIESNHIDWIIIPDSEKKLIQKKYNIYSYPTLFLIDSEGKIVLKGSSLRGSNFLAELKKRIKTE